MEPIKVYAVEGCSSSYSDYSTWVVVVFFDKQQAEDTAKYLNDLIESNPIEKKNQEWDAAIKQRLKTSTTLEEYTAWHAEHNKYWTSVMFPDHGYGAGDTEYTVLELEVV